MSESTPTIPDLESVKSGALEAVGHDGEHLYVRFPPSKKTGERPVWRYRDVPASTHQEMMRSGSVGKYLHAFIKPNFPGERVA